MHQPTFDVDAASILFNLPGYRVVSASAAVGDQPRQVLIETVASEGAEHRFRTVRYLRDPDTHAVKRVEPWSIVFTDLDDGAILDVVDGRRGATEAAGTRPRGARRLAHPASVGAACHRPSAPSRRAPAAAACVSRGS